MKTVSRCALALLFVVAVVVLIAENGATIRHEQQLTRNSSGNTTQ